MLHIKIVDEETQKVLVDDKTNLIIGSFGKGKKGESGMGFINGCTGNELMAVLLSVKEVIKDTLVKYPEIAFMLNLYERKENKTNEQ